MSNRLEIETFSVNWLALNFDMDPRTVRKRLIRAGVEPVAIRDRAAVYRLKEAAPAILMGRLAYLMPDIRRVARFQQFKKIKIVVAD